MNKLNKLSGQELSKQQMNQVTGGMYTCTATDEHGNVVGTGRFDKHIAGAHTTMGVEMQRAGWKSNQYEISCV